MKEFWFVSAVLSVLGLAKWNALAGETQKVIDLHCHVAGIGAGGSGCFVSDRLRQNWRYRFFLKAFGVTGNELLKEGDGLVLKRLSERLSTSRSVSAAVVLAMDGIVGEDGELDKVRTEIYIPNEFVAAEIRKYPNLLFGASINPYRRDAIERLEQAVCDGAILVKWLPPIQDIDPSDERLVPFYLKLKELGLPLLTHTGTERSFTRSRDELADPERLRLPLSLGVTVIAAHCACGGRTQGRSNYERFLRLCREYPNLYGDISALTQMNRLGQLKQVLAQPELKGRLFYGSDMPLINTAAVTPFAYAFGLPLRQMIAIARIENPWDRDVALKKALGTGEDVFIHAAECLKLRTETAVQ
jgi:predicted TIM-barrel fold metal-dependent hydrolase